MFKREVEVEVDEEEAEVGTCIDIGRVKLSGYNWYCDYCQMQNRFLLGNTLFIWLTHNGTTHMQVKEGNHLKGGSI